MSHEMRDVGPSPLARRRGTDLADLLERILDKGVVIAGDIRVDLVSIELLTIKVRLLIAGVDKAREMGIDWWENDPFLTSRAPDLSEQNALLQEQVATLKAELAGRAVEDEPSHEEPRPDR